MKSIFPLLALSIVLASPAVAQRMGGTNNNAPTLTQSFAGGDLEVQVEYRAITWAGGNFMTTVMDKEKGERYRSFVNSKAAGSPLGSLRTETALKIGDQDLPKGLYSLYFTIDDNAKWHMHAQDETKKSNHFEWTLELKTTKKSRSRLQVLLLPADEVGSCDIDIAFGSMQGSVAVTKSTKKFKKPASKPTTRSKRSR